MWRRLRWLLGKLWLLVAIVVILTAVATVTVRLMLPMLGQYKTEIEQAASAALGRAVRIEKIEVGWRGLSPQIRLQDVRILRSAQGPVLVHLSRVSIGIDLLRSLMQMRPTLGAVLIEGVNLKLDRDAQGRVSLSGLPLALPPTGDTAGANAPIDWLYGTRIELEHANIWLKDARSGVDDRISHLALTMQITGGGELRIAGKARLPAQLGRRVTFVAALRGVLASGHRLSGRIYLDLQGGRLDTPLLRKLQPSLPAMQGVLDARLWSRWQDGRLESVSGHVGVSGLAFAKPSLRGTTSPTAMLTGLSADVSWTQATAGWQLAAQHVQVAAASRAWPPSAFSVAVSRTSAGRRIEGWATFLRLQNLVPLVEAQSRVPTGLRRRLRAVAPRGDVSALRFDVMLPHKGAPQVSASARFAKIASNPLDGIPGVRGASGILRATPQGGSLALDSSALVIDAPRLFTTVLPAVAAHGVIRWEVHPDGLAFHSDEIRLSNADLSARGQFGLRLPSGGAPYLNLQVHLNRANVAQARRYLPYHLFDAKLSHFLSTGLLGGQVTDGSFVLRGELRQFPFPKHGGVFKARFHMQNGVVAYFENWPRLSQLQGEVVFDGPRLQVNANGGQILNTRIESARLNIPNIEKPRLDIHARASGPLADAPIYLAYTPVADGRQALFKEMRGGGQEQITLNIVLPFVRGELKHWRLQGAVKVSHGSFALPAQGFALHAINGRFNFTQRSLTAKNVAARFRGQPVQLASTTRPDGLASLTLDGGFTVADLLGKKSPILRFAHGKANLRVVFTLPMTSALFRRDGAGITVASGLRNVVVNLPAPLAKPAGRSRGFVLRFSVTRPDSPIWLRYGKSLQAVLRLAGKGSCRYLAAADVRYDRGQPKLPAQGITLEASVPYIDADAWQALKFGGASAFTTAPGCPDGIGATLNRLRSLDLRVKRMRLFGQDVRSLDVQAQRHRSEWQTKLRSNLLTGSLQIPLNLHGGTPLRFDISRLVLPVSGWSVPSSAGMSLNPAELPPFSGHIAQIDIAGRQIDGVSLRTTPLSNGLKIHQLKIDEPNLKVRITGDWLRTGDKDHTRLQVELDSDSLGKAMQRLKLSSGISGGKGHASAALDWSGPLFAPSWKRLTGQANLSFSDGRIDQINPGDAGRLLGLINLSQLPRNLMTGFSNLFHKGMPFNTIKGNLQFRSGNLYTQNLVMTGPSADIKVKGRLGIVARNIDATVTAVPQIGSILTIAGAVAGGPAAGAVIYLLDHVLGIGKQINKAVEIKYHVGGSWSAPQIKPESTSHGVSAAPHHADSPYGS